jgi:hypothetical protein
MKSVILIPGQVLANVFSKRNDEVRSIEDWFNQFVTSDDFNWAWNWMSDRDVIEVRMWGDDLPVSAATTYWMSHIIEYATMGSTIRFSVADEGERLEG